MRTRRGRRTGLPIRVGAVSEGFGILRVWQRPAPRPRGRIATGPLPRSRPGLPFPMPEIDPDWRPVAFKEWQLVAEALVRGEQSVLLRKGGISEGKAGFQWLHDRFFLFPSLFHEQAEQVKPRADGSPRTLPEPAGGGNEVVFSVYVETLATGRLTDWEEVRRLDPFHIWKEDIVRERFDWGDEPGISWAVVRAHELAHPWVLEDRKSFGGCRSWFGLPVDEGGGWIERVRSAREVEPACGRPDWLG